MNQDIKEVLIVIGFIVLGVFSAWIIGITLHNSTSQKASEPAKIERMTPVPVESIKCIEIAENGSFCRVYEVHRLTSTE